MRGSHVADLRGRPEPALLERAMTLAGTRPPAKGLPTPRFALAHQWLWAGDLETARELLDAELSAARGWGDESFTQRVLVTLVDLEWRAGNWDLAERYLEEHRQLAFDGNNRWDEGVARWQQALFAASRGRAEEARQLALETVSLGEEFHRPWLALRGQWVLGFLALSLDEPAAAIGALRSAPEAVSKFGVHDAGPATILPDALEAAVGVGLLDEAEAILARFERHALGRGGWWTTPAILRCRALLLLAQGESEAALAAAEQAASDFEAACFPLDHGRALLVAGEALKRSGERRRAGAKLEAAKSVFSGLGAPLWLARAEKELRRARPRPRSDRELTSAERRVAALVAEGRTNREVSAQLFTTVGTVEVHLTRIYRKLGLRSRTELARLVADGTLDLEDA
jgi:DNA-binding CsgD family transcriptional regulator